MSNETIDVLAVMGKAMTQVRHCHEAHEIQEARKAIAELIDADREYDLAATALLACTNKPAHTLVMLIDYADEARSRFEAAKTSRAAALARVGATK